MISTRNVIFGVVAALIGLLLFLGLRPQPVLVEVTEVVRAPLRVSIEEEGVTRLKDRYLVSAPVSGFVRRIDWEVGDLFKQNDLLTELEPLRSNVLDPRSRAEAEARIAAARSALSAAEEQAAAAGADAERYAEEYQRKLKLSKTRVISEDELSQARADNQRAKALLRSAQFAVDVARYDLDAASTQLKYSAAQNSVGVLKERVPIKAPVSGRVLKILRESEGVVVAGTPLLELGDPAALEVAVDVLSFDAVQISPGTPVELQRWGGQLLQGVVRLVEPVGFTEVSALGVEEQRVWVIVDITSGAEQWKNLGDGYRIEATFILWDGDDVLQVPNASLFRISGEWALFLVNDGYAELRKVRLGKRNGLYSQVIEGVALGERVIQHPDNNLADGKRIKIRQVNIR
ncbi:HlyD family efflux transporter periplasmic adaptor subunit [Aestuariicella hydrocarbonica]|uniref:HlyD family efflux transporter periplasmic adaptor subunit n=1 Tax=Pseudomaricurvus hydrocarbonicus TaxID=1470433 RepID=A0A9E5JS38_9GAMM|nr:HlyD family efflux transporter periplasmic adaptor subunit [Aestuariicella hydrocarbonica]NHO65733.1 HlyD family efflux transporter periplasmic adaptor subunit [Aestuariicella hydrocarbonica]